MKETPQQYIERVRGYLDGKKPMEVLASSPRQLARLIQGVTKKKLAKRPAPDKWSVTEILAHLADTELVQGFRLRSSWEQAAAPFKASTRTNGPATPTTQSMTPRCP